MGPSYGWRSPFLVISIPCLLCALLILTTTVEPSRGGQEEVVLAMHRTRKEYLMNAEDKRQNRKSTERAIYSSEEEKEEKKASIIYDVTIINPLQPPIENGGPPEANIPVQYDQRQSHVEKKTEKVRAESNSIHHELCVDDLAYEEQINWTKCSNIFLTPTVVLIFVQALPGCLPWGQ